MGNKASTEYGGIFVQTSKSQYFPGELIKGTISLHITKQGYPARYIKVIITGKEILHRAYDIDSDSESETNYNTNKSVQILKNEITIYKFQQAIVPNGQFQTQFSFQLPHGIPGTFNNNHLSGAFERIIYKVKAIVIASKGYKNMTHLQQIQIREPVYQPEQQVIGDGQISDNGYCCRGKGIAYITAVTDRNLYRIGEAIRILLEVNDDDNQVKPEKIIIQLENTQEFNFNSNREKYSKILQEIEIYPKTQRLGSKKVLNSQEVVLFVSHQNHNNNDQHNMVQPSTNGKLIKSYYNVLIKAKFGITSCLSSNEFIKLPIQVLASTILQQNKINTPQNWNPVTLSDEILEQLSNNKSNSLSLRSFSTHHKSMIDRNSYDFQESQQSIKFRNSSRQIQTLNQQMI